jgi:regulator of replication initiation timing
LAAAASGTPVAASTLEVAQLQRTLAMVMKENKALKEDVRHLREKLDQIKKFAA